MKSRLLETTKQIIVVAALTLTVIFTTNTAQAFLFPEALIIGIAAALWGDSINNNLDTSSPEDQAWIKVKSNIERIKQYVYWANEYARRNPEKLNTARWQSMNASVYDALNLFVENIVSPYSNDPSLIASFGSPSLDNGQRNDEYYATVGTLAIEVYRKHFPGLLGQAQSSEQIFGN